MCTLNARVNDFLAQRRVAVVGVSRTRLWQTGEAVFRS